MKLSAKYKVPYHKLDFINIELSGDNKYFIDPYKLKKGEGEFEQKCYQKVDWFIKKLLKLVREKKIKEANEIIGNLYERNETKLGYSLETEYGKSLGENGGKILIKTLARSDVMLTGLVEDIFDCLIMLPNVGEDKVSDLITTIIFLDLIEYTQKQCEVWNIPMKEVELARLCWDANDENWKKVKTKLPVHLDLPIVFVPKRIVTSNELEFSYERLYRQVIIPLYKQREFETRGSNLVVKFKNGRKQVLGNELRKLYPCTKYVVLDFVKKYDVYYREFKRKIID